MRSNGQAGDWIAASVCHNVPHRQFVFTFPRMLRGIFRKRRHFEVFTAIHPAEARRPRR